MASLDDLPSKPDIQLTDEQTMSPSSEKRDKLTKKKKVTRATPSNNDKSKTSTSVCQARETATVRDVLAMPTRRQISLAQAAQLIADAQFLVRVSNATSENPTEQSTMGPVKVENVDSSPEAKTLLLQIKKSNEMVDSQINESTMPRKKEQEAAGYLTKQVLVQSKANPPRKPGQKNWLLVKKFASGDALDLSGTADLSSLGVIDSDMPLIIEQVFRQENKKCSQLILRDNYLTGHGVKLLVDELLRVPTKLRSLILSNNVAIGDVGVQHCARLIQASRSLTFLALHYTSMTDRSVRMLADVLCREAAASPPARLEKLFMSFNPSITDSSLDALVQILEQNKKLKTLGLERCSLSDDTCQQLKQVAEKNKTKLNL